MNNDLFQQEQSAEQNNQPAEPVSLNLQTALKEHEERLKELMKTANSYVGALKRWMKACQTGNVSDMQKAMEQALKLSQEIEPRTGDVKSAWSFDVRTYLETGAWIPELQSVLMENYSLSTLADENGNLISSPVIVRAQPARSALQIGKQGWMTLHPQVTAKELKRLRDHQANAAVQELLEALYAKWERHKQPGGVALLRVIYEDLAETPGWKRENSKSKFGQDLYALDRSGILTTRKGARCKLIPPSGRYGERDIFTVIAEDGKPVRYYGIRFL